jgi:hypothetical protein
MKRNKFLCISVVPRVHTELGCGGQARCSRSFLMQQLPQEKKTEYFQDGLDAHRANFLALEALQLLQVGRS